MLLISSLKGQGLDGRRGTLLLAENAALGGSV